MADSGQCHTSSQIKWSQLISQYNLCTVSMTGDFDEVWLIGGAYFGMYESRLIGLNIYIQLTGLYNFCMFELACYGPLLQSG
jgi:hypothetical protein